MRSVEKAHLCFLRGDYSNALLNFSIALKDNPQDKEAKVGALLADLAKESEEKATSLYEYYLITKEQGVENPEELIEEIIDSFDNGFEKLMDLRYEFEEDANIVPDSISYDDFKHHVEQRGDFKKAYEDIMFGTKVTISSKEDFIHFAKNLIKYGYEDIADRYIEHFKMFFSTNNILNEIYSPKK
jgi:tetratricopeptide (TPR) repeat protein